MFCFKFTIAAVMLSTITCFAQVSFKKGYYIDKEGNKTFCFIKDVGWKNSPSSFDYRLEENGFTEKKYTETVSEFVVGSTKYIRATVQYDRSPQEIRMLGITSSPDWIEANLLLKVIVEGKGTLYHYSSPEFSLFFFSVSGSPIEQLIFKNYLDHSDHTQMRSNRSYLSQLNSRLRCTDMEPATDRNAPYELKPLAAFFRNYNICSGEVVQASPKQKSAFSLRLTPGIDFSNAYASVRNAIASNKYDFGSNTRSRLGVELQLTLPFNQGKWAVIIEPTYQYFSSGGTQGLSYKTIETPIGLRHRFFLSKKSTIFINGMVVMDFPLTHVQHLTSTIDITMDSGAIGFAAGAGYSFGRFSLEGRYYPERTRSQAAIAVYHYTKSSIILGFRIF